MSKEHIFVGLSGGVDSSVTALLLQQQGKQVSGLFMKNWEEDDASGICPATQDANDARAIAEQLNIPFYTRNFSTEYWDDVFEFFLSEHRAGRTPNPDILCNKEIKFKTFIDHAKDLGATKIATGHYARIQKHDEKYQLLKGNDPQKDQSYFLHQLSQEQLAQAIFPIGDLLKSEIRLLASRNSFTNALKKDSTGICFIGEHRFKLFLSNFIDKKLGLIKTPNMKTIGEHDGIYFYTIGQRNGLGIGGIKGYSEEPWYVVGKDVKNNIVIVDQGESPHLFATQLKTEHIHWISENKPEENKLKAKIRYRQSDQDCFIEEDTDGSYFVLFNEPQRAVTPGQSIVFYDGDICLGGGIIASSNATYGELT